MQLSPVRVSETGGLVPMAVLGAHRYHVHEKAVLMISVSLGILAAAGLMPGGGAAAMSQFFFLNTGVCVFWCSLWDACSGSSKGAG